MTTSRSNSRLASIAAWIAHEICLQLGLLDS